MIWRYLLVHSKKTGSDSATLQYCTLYNMYTVPSVLYLMVYGLNPAFVFFLLSIFSLNKVSILLLGWEKGWGLQLQLCSPSNRELFPQIRGNSSHKYEGIILTNQIPSFSWSVQKTVFFTLYWNISREYLVVYSNFNEWLGFDPYFTAKLQR